MNDGLWDEVLAQPAATAALRAALVTDGMAHAWLLSGPRLVGQAELARALGAAVNCPSAPERDRGCGDCSTCRRISEDRHPAVLAFEPEGAAHRVQDVREVWIPTATRTLSEGRRRILRVVAADRMNEAAQNAFLKILEEPPASAIWLLEAEDEGALLDTVLSRCRRLNLVPFGPAALQERASRLGIPAEQRQVLVRASLGLPQRLQDLADPDVADARVRHLGIVDRLAVGGPGQVVPIAKELVAWAKGRSAVVKTRNAEELARLEDAFGVEGNRGWPPGIRARLTRTHERREKHEQRRALDLVLDDLSSYLRDLLAVHGGAGPDALVNGDRAGELARDAGRLPPEAAVRGLAAVADCRRALEANGAAELQLERLLMSLALPLHATGVVTSVR